MRTKPRRKDLSVAESSTGNGAGGRGGDENARGLLEPVPLAAYELLPPPTLRPDQIDAIVTRHGLAIDGPILAMASKGVVHGLWALGTHWVLRVPKNEAMCLGDHRCEAAAIPLARVAGVTTPDLIVFDDSGAILDVPYSVVERVDGADLVAHHIGDDATTDAYRRLGEQLAILHNATVPEITNPYLRVPNATPAEQYFDDALLHGVLHADGIAWLRNLCERLDTVIAAAGRVPRVFVHDDVKPDNVMVDRIGIVHTVTDLLTFAAQRPDTWHAWTELH